MRASIALLTALLTVTAVSAEPMDSRVAIESLTASIEPATAAPGQIVTWKLTLQLKPGWHTYPTAQVDQKAASSVNVFKFPGDGWESVSELVEPTFQTKSEDDIKELRYYEDEIVWHRKLRVPANSKPGTKSLDVQVRVLACDKNSCRPPVNLKTSATLTVAGPAASLDVKPATVSPPSVTPAAEPPPPAGTVEYAARLDAIAAQLGREKVAAHTGLGAFLLTAIFWGAVSLATPCVFPMIPITVSFFLKQSEKSHQSPLVLASVYSMTIIVVLGTASLTLLGFFQKLSVNPIMNFGLGVVFIALALSLFGMYELTLPSFLSRFTDTRARAGGVLGTVFMALTFTIVSFTCVAPFLGGFGGMAASGQFQLYELILGALAYSATFAAPFFVLALFPSLLKKLPKSGGWLNSVKVVMGFLELAAALKFFRAGELILSAKPTLFTYDLVLGIWVALLVVGGLYLVNLFRIGHDEPLETVPVPRFLLGVGWIGLAVYLLPALFTTGPEGEKQRPNGAVYAWVDSFLLPEPSANGLPWSGDLARAIDVARAENKLVFVDFTGETCTNCKLNERNVLSLREVQDLLKQYKLAQLYTDKVPDAFYPASVRQSFRDTNRQQADAQANLIFQDKAFGTAQLPLYVILKPLPGGGIERVGVYDEGKINNAAKFAEFLRGPLAK